MATVKSILKFDRSKKVLVWPNMLVIQALERMAKYDLGALLVYKEGQIQGVFSERDYARNVLLEERSARTTKVSEVMTKKVICVLPETTLEECMALMADKRVRHLPVVSEENRLIDFVSMRDVVEGVVSDRDYMIDQLNRYITGTYVSLTGDHHNTEAV